MIKQAIKDKTAPNLSKFNALYLLKELMKSRNKRFVDYVEKKMAPRLALLATSEKGDDCLLIFNRNSDSVWSKNFHHLNLECFQNWAHIFPNSNPLFSRTVGKLKVTKRLPIENKFYEIGPIEIEEPINQWDHSLMVTGGAKITEKFGRAKKARNALKEYLNTGQFLLLEDSLIPELYQRYKGAYDEANNDPQTQTLLQSMDQRIDASDKKLAEDINLEAIFAEQLQHIFEQAMQQKNPVLFLESFENCYNALFELEPVNFTAQINRLKEKEAFQKSSEDQKRTIKGVTDGNKKVDNLPYQNTAEFLYNPTNDPIPRQDYAFADYHVDDFHKNEGEIKPMSINMVQQQSDSRPNNIKKENIGARVADDSYNFNLPADNKINNRVNPNFIDPPQEIGAIQKKTIPSEYPNSQFGTNKVPKENNVGINLKRMEELHQENLVLKRDIDELENKKRNLESKVSKRVGGKTDKINSKLMNQSSILPPQNEGAGFIKVLKTKDDQIERLAHKINRLEKELQRTPYEEESPEPVRSSRKRILDDISMDVSAHGDLIGAGRYESARKILKKRAEKEAEATGSLFVDQMYKDINRLLNKPARSQFSNRSIIY